MKFVDERGMVFGKINIIDMAIVLFLLMFVPALYFGYRVATVENKTVQYGNLEVTAKFLMLEPEVAAAISKGDIGRSPMGDNNGVVIEVKSIKPSESVVTISDGSMVASKHPFKKDVIARFDITCVKKEGSFFNNDKPVKIGHDLYFSTSTYEIIGTITDLKVKE